MFLAHQGLVTCRKLCLVAALALCSAPVFAQPTSEPNPGPSSNETSTRARVEVVRSSDAFECPDTTALVARVIALRGSLSTRAELGSILLKVELSRANPGFSGTLRVSGLRGGIRRLHDDGPGCEGLAEAAAVSIAVILDDEPESRNTLVPDPDPPAQDPPRPTPAPRPIKASRDRSMSLEAIGVAGLGVGLPSRASFVAAAGLEAHFGSRWTSLLRAGWTPRQSHAFRQGTVDVSFVHAQIAACYRLVGDVSGTSLSGCADLALGSLRGEGHGYAPDRSASKLWAAGGASLLVEGSITGPLGWTAHAGAVAPFHKVTFSVDGQGVGFTSSAAGFFVLPGLRVRFL